MDLQRPHHRTATLVRRSSTTSRHRSALRLGMSGYAESRRQLAMLQDGRDIGLSRKAFFKSTVEESRRL
jgi:hypothetical protein